MYPIFKACVFILFISYVCSDRPCAPRSYGVNRVVCVCNATYCDTIDRVALPPVGQYVKYSSSQAGLRFSKTTGTLGSIRVLQWFFDTNHHIVNGVHMKVLRRTTYQKIIGFGAAITDSAGMNILSLTPPAQENLLRSFFSPEGLEYNIVRMPIGGSDYSTHIYTYNDFPGDVTLQHFRLATEDHLDKIPVIKRILAMSEKRIHLKGATWSAPIWMKTNNAINGFGFIKDEYYQLWADYIIKFLDAYHDEGIDFWAISTGNEPSSGFLLTSLNWIPTVAWSPKGVFKWLGENLGPTLKRSQHNKTKIIALDDQRTLLPWWFDPLRTDLETAEYIDGIAIHWYADVISSPWVLDQTRESFPNKFLLQTEASAGLNVWNPFAKPVEYGSWRRGELYMKSIIEYLSHWTSGWLDWNLAVNPDGGPNFLPLGAVDGSLIVNSVNDEFYKQPMFYAMGHFSKFVPEGSVRISITPQNQGGLESIAFQKTDNATVIVVWNKSDWKVPLTITDDDRGIINFTVDPKSFHTITYL